MSDLYASIGVVGLDRVPGIFDLSDLLPVAGYRMWCSSVLHTERMVLTGPFVGRAPTGLWMIGDGNVDGLIPMAVSWNDAVR